MTVAHGRTPVADERGLHVQPVGAADLSHPSWARDSDPSASASKTAARSISVRAGLVTRIACRISTSFSRTGARCTITPSTRALRPSGTVISSKSVSGVIPSIAAAERWETADRGPAASRAARNHINHEGTAHPSR